MSNKRYKYKFKKGDTFELDKSFIIGGKREKITITRLEQNGDMLPSYWIGEKNQKRYSKFDGCISKKELEYNVQIGKWRILI